MDNEAFIQEKLPLLLSSELFNSKTMGLKAGWRLHQIDSHHGTPRNIEFGLIVVNDANQYLVVFGKINRATSRFSNIEIRDY